MMNNNRNSNDNNWCPNTVYHLNCDNNQTLNTSSNYAGDGNSIQNSQISFTYDSTKIPINYVDSVDGCVNNNHSFDFHNRLDQNDSTLPPQPASSSSSASSSQYLIKNNSNNNNFDIHLAQIDIETFKSEDIRRIPFVVNNQSMMNASNDDTLRIVDSISSFTNTNGFLEPPNNNQTTLSIDSLDLSIDDDNNNDDEINSELIQKCSERNDKTKYKIAMIDSQMQISSASSNNNNNNNPFQPSPLLLNDSINEIIQSPGSLVKMFMQKNKQKQHSNEDSILSSSQLIFDTKNNNDNIENGTTTNTSSLNTIDSNELPLYVLDLSKKLRSLNMSNDCNNKQQQILMNNINNNYPKFIGSQTSSNTTSFTSTTTTSSSAATNEIYNRRKQKQNINKQTTIPAAIKTNPFLNISQTESNSNEIGKNTRSISTQFPDLYQDKQVQASFDYDYNNNDYNDSNVIKESPVLVYYPNYSLPDLSFLQEIFQQQNNANRVYLSPVKHETIKTHDDDENKNHNVKMRQNQPDNNRKKCRPKSYTDYETLLNQDLSHIKDWDSLNLLLPDDFREFIEQNNLLKISKQNLSNENSSLIDDDNQNRSEQRKPIIKKMIPNSHRLFQNNNNNNNVINGVRMRPKSMKLVNHNKRYSLQECHYNQLNNNNNNNNPFNVYYDYYQHAGPHHMHELDDISSMTRSKTMPNCQLQNIPNVYMPHQHSHHYHHRHQPIPPQANAPLSSCMIHCSSCSCIVCYQQQQQYQMQKPSSSSSNINWDLLSSSESIKKLLSFLSKLDEYSSTHSSSTADTTTVTINNNHNNNNTNDIRPKSEVHREATKSNATTTKPKSSTIMPTRNDRQQQRKLTERYNNSHNNDKNSKLRKNSIRNNGKTTTIENNDIDVHNNNNAVNTSTANVQTMKNSKIILKRPNQLNYRNLNNLHTTITPQQSSGIPISTRNQSSMIPVLNKNLQTNQNNSTMQTFMALNNNYNNNNNINSHYRNRQRRLH